MSQRRRPAQPTSTPASKSTTFRHPSVDSMDLTFLGTSAGKPSTSRNVSSLALRLDGDIWLFDAGEATQHQFMRSNLKMGSITKIFLTHTHGDHIFGLVPLLCTLSDGLGGTIKDPSPSRTPSSSEPDRLIASHSPQTPTISIYGPSGTRELLRTTLRITYTTLARRYKVNELLFRCDGNDDRPFPQRDEDLHPNEDRGRDIWQGDDGLWRDFEDDRGLKVSAGPILHTGYVLTEHPSPTPLNPTLIIPQINKHSTHLISLGFDPPVKALSHLQKHREPIPLPDGTSLQPPPLDRPGRKLAILGDTYDASSLVGLARDADVCVHECTNAWLPEFDPAGVKAGETSESVRERSKSRGHSTAEVAGGFARRINARNLILNHFSSRYADPGDDPTTTTTTTTMKVNEPFKASDGNESAQPPTTASQRQKVEIMNAIGKLASEAWGGGQAICARDFMNFVVPKRAALAREGEGSGDGVVKS